MKITASLVLYNPNIADCRDSIYSYFEGCDGLLYIVDNSDAAQVDDVFKHPRIRYVHAARNLGFGRAHNVAIGMIGNTSDLHLILNPDIKFAADVLPRLLAFMQTHQSAVTVMPRINYPNNDLQRLCKLLPNPLDLLFRRFLPFTSIKNYFNSRYELYGLPQDRATQVPALSGCFLLIRMKILQSIGGFDERYFMYMEDVDLVRRLGDLGETMYYPDVGVIHGYAKGSYVDKKLLGYHLISAIKYFFKWGWLFDSTRRRRNREVLRLVENNSKIQ